MPRSLPVADFRPLLCMVLAAALYGATVAAAAPVADRMGFPGSIKELSAPSNGARGAASVSRTTLLAAEGEASMTFEVALRMRRFAELQARIAKGEKIAPAEMEAKYYPLAADHDRLVQWLRAQGLEVTRTDPNRIGVFGRGSVNSVARAFQANFARVVGEDGREYTSAITAPSLPSDLAPVVLGLHGLQPHLRPRPLSIPRRESPRLTVNFGGYLPASIAKAYNEGLTATTGTGQTIAVYAFEYPMVSDVTSFWTLADDAEPSTNLQMIDVAGGPKTSGSTATDEGYEQEATLDTEWASGLAPGAKIRIYGGNVNDPGNNDEILQQIFADHASYPTMNQMCICIGANELDVERDYLIIEGQYMANLASAGVSILVASGDNGSNPEGKLQVTYPTSDPDVTGVGGTSLTAATVPPVETAWNSNGGSTGGGVSLVFSRPPWQVGSSVPVGTMRLVPDVAATADPSYGATVYFHGATMTLGGTSWAAPVWAGFCAAMNQSRATPLGLLNPTLYPLLGTPSFNDITSGNNGAYSAGPGYDLCTGLGSPNVGNIEAATATAKEPLAANIPTQLGDIFTTVGQPATLVVIGDGAPPLSYQWQREPYDSSTWSNLSDGANYSGTLTPSLVVHNTTTSMSGDLFRCVVSNSSGSATSAPSSMLTVSPVGVTTLAGWPGSAGHADGTGWAARFAYPGSVRTDGAGNVYIADSYNDTVRMVTPAGVTTTVAGTPEVTGSTNGPAATALFSGTAGVAVDSAGNLFVADDTNALIREISASGTVTTLAGTVGSTGEVDGTGTAAKFFDPQNLAIDAAGNLYVADGMGNVIRKVTPAGVVTTFAGTGVDGAAGKAGSADGTGAAAQFNDPTGVAVDALGNVYVADHGNDTIRKITPAGVVTTIAGTALTSGSADGTGAAASFDGPAGLGVDSAGNLYVADSVNNTIREVTPAGVVTTVAGLAGVAENTDGLPGDARFNSPGDVAVDANGVLYVADALNDTIRRIVPGLTASAPSIAAQPANADVNEGSQAVFDVGVNGTAPFTYQWYLNGVAIPGAIEGTYTVADAQQSEEGSYTVNVTNSLGSATSSAATLTVAVPAGYPDITAQPQGATLVNGGSVILSITAAGNPPFTYQWYFNGAVISGATASTYTATTPGSYTVAVTNPLATAISSPAVVSGGSRLHNLSTLAQVGTGANVTIVGFVITGPAGVGKPVLIRGDGPGLADFSLTGYLTQPVLTVSNTSSSPSTVVATNTGWGTNADPAQITSVSAQVGAFAFAPGSADSALFLSLTPGNYTAELSGLGGTTGLGLVEVYEQNATDPALLTNLSTFSHVGTGTNILTAGFVITGNQPATVLIRGSGPTLAAFSIANFLAQPVLTVVNTTQSPNVTVATNTGWENGPNPSQVASVAAQVGAFAYPAGSADSALVLTLQPGNYTANVSGANGTTGTALVEVYQVQP